MPDASTPEEIALVLFSPAAVEDLFSEIWYMYRGNAITKGTEENDPASLS